MTVTSTKITAGPYAGNGVSDTFSYTFGLEDKSEIRVFETDDIGFETELTVDTDYTVNGVGVQTGGDVTRNAGPLPSGYEWYMRSNYPETQLTEFESQGAFFPDIHEKAFDKPTRLIQQLSDALSRTLRLSESYSGDYDLTLPTPVDGDLLRFTANGIEGLTIGEILASAVIIANLDMNGYKILNLPDAGTAQEPATLQQVTNMVIDSGGGGLGDNSLITASGTTTARTLANRFADTPNVSDEGASGGTLDDTVALQAAFTAMAPDGIVSIPRGTFTLSNYILVPQNVRKILMSSETEIIQTGKFPIFLKQGSIDLVGAVSVSVNLLKGNTFITTDTPHGYVAGDWVYIRCNDLTPNITAGSRVSILRKVLEVGASTFRIDKPVFRDMTTDITIRKAFLGDDIVIEGGILSSLIPVDNKEALIHFYMSKGPVIRNVTIKDSGGPAVLLTNCVGGRFVDSDIHDMLDHEHTDSENVTSEYRGYGIAFAGATRDFVVESGTIGRVRHAMTTITANNDSYDGIPISDQGTVSLRGEPENIYFGPVHCYETTEAALDTHEQGYHITLVPNLTGCFRGILIRATDVTVNGGTIDGVRRYGISISGPASNAAVSISLRPVIKNTVINTVGEDGFNQGQESKGIIDDTDASVIDINGVTIKGCREESINITGDSILRLRSSTIDNFNTQTLNTGIRLEGSGSLIESVTIMNCNKGISESIGANNTRTNVLYDNNVTDYIQE